ncbi:MAG: CDP-alcohol phosphatidyltransferase family protein [Bacteroidales bacterium]
MNSMKKGLPSVFTSLGLISGCISIVAALSYGELLLAGYFILIAALFDFLDGLVARSLNSITEFGKQLDSLADVVSFGVAPSMILYRLLLLSYVRSSPGADFDVMNPGPGEGVVLYAAFLVAVFSALRLAKFNLDTGQVKSFRGLPTPANAIFIAALGFVAENSRDFPFAGLVFNRYFLLAIVILSCFLLVSNIRMFSLKFSSFDPAKNWMRYLFLILSVLLIILFGLPGLAPVIILYILLSVISRYLKAEPE